MIEERTLIEFPKCCNYTLSMTNMAFSVFLRSLHVPREIIRDRPAHADEQPVREVLLSAGMGQQRCRRNRLCRGGVLRGFPPTQRYLLPNIREGSMLFHWNEMWLVNYNFVIYGLKRANLHCGNS